MKYHMLKGKHFLIKWLKKKLIVKHQINAFLTTFGFHIKFFSFYDIENSGGFIKEKNVTNYFFQGFKMPLQNFCIDFRHKIFDFVYFFIETWYCGASENHLKMLTYKLYSFLPQRSISLKQVINYS